MRFTRADPAIPLWGLCIRPILKVDRYRSYRKIKIRLDCVYFLQICVYFSKCKLRKYFLLPKVRKSQGQHFLLHIYYNGANFKSITHLNWKRFKTMTRIKIGEKEKKIGLVEFCRAFPIFQKVRDSSNVSEESVVIASTYIKEYMSSYRNQLHNSLAYLKKGKGRS